LKELPAKVQEAADITLKRSALKIQKDIVDIFKTQGASQGIEWAPLTKQYLKEKIRKGYSEKKLIRTSTLMQSWTWRLQPWMAVVGTEVPYAIYNEMGTYKMPARPFAKPVKEAFEKQQIAEKLFVKTIDEVLKGV
jgi:TP901-1 ORF40-like protein.